MIKITTLECLIGYLESLNIERKPTINIDYPVYYKPARYFTLRTTLALLKPEIKTEEDYILAKWGRTSLGGMGSAILAYNFIHFNSMEIALSNCIEDIVSQIELFIDNPAPFIRARTDELYAQRSLNND